MLYPVCKAYGVKVFDVLTGFKFIGEKIKQLDDTGKRKYIFGFEESCGYLRGTHCRDKDAVVASMLFAEMVCYYTYNKRYEPSRIAHHQQHPHHTQQCTEGCGMIVEWIEEFKDYKQQYNSRCRV